MVPVRAARCKDYRNPTVRSECFRTERRTRADQRLGDAIRPVNPFTIAITRRYRRRTARPAGSACCGACEPGVCMRRSWRWGLRRRKGRRADGGRDDVDDVTGRTCRTGSRVVGVGLSAAQRGRLWHQDFVYEHHVERLRCDRLVGVGCAHGECRCSASRSAADRLTALGSAGCVPRRRDRADELQSNAHGLSAVRVRRPGRRTGRHAYRCGVVEDRAPNTETTGSMGIDWCVWTLRSDVDLETTLELIRSEFPQSPP